MADVQLLNFQFQHNPYQQGNNNLGTLFRTDNQLSVNTLNVVYNKALKTKTITTILSYVNSQIDYNNGMLLVGNTMYMFNTSINAKKLITSLSVSRNVTGPHIDTLNFRGCRIGLSQKNGNKVNFVIHGFLDQFDF